MQKNDLKNIDLRSLFPIFSQKVHGWPLIFLDNASTAQMPQKVLDAMVDYYSCYKSNVGRGIYSFAEQATAKYEQARSKVAKFINAQTKEIIFTSGATDSINLVAQAWASNVLQQGDEIIISDVEHHSNFIPWQQLALQKKLILKIIPVTVDGVVDVIEFEKKLTDKTKFVSFFHTSNVTGATNDVITLTEMAHRVGAKVLIDACQSVMHQTIDVLKIKADFLVFSGHKLFGPTGVGVLYVAQNLLEIMQLQKFGGGMVFSVAKNSSEFKPAPHCFEAGTPNIAGVIGLGAAVDFVQNYIDFSKTSRHETTLVTMLCDGLKKFKDVTMVSVIPKVSTQNVSIVTFYSTQHHAHDIAAYLDQHGIAVRAGHHCVQIFHQNKNINASVRISFAPYNTVAEVEFLLTTLNKILG